MILVSAMICRFLHSICEALTRYTQCDCAANALEMIDVDEYTLLWGRYEGNQKYKQ